MPAGFIVLPAWGAMIAREVNDCSPDEWTQPQIKKGRDKPCLFAKPRLEDVSKTKTREEWKSFHRKGRQGREGKTEHKGK
jgi:hypothetical protein